MLDLIWRIVPSFGHQEMRKMPEEVQKRATKMIPSLRSFSYEERLKRLGMYSLRCGRLSGDMTEVLKMIEGIDTINLEKPFLQI